MLDIARAGRALRGATSQTKPHASARDRGTATGQAQRRHGERRRAATYQAIVNLVEGKFVTFARTKFWRPTQHAQRDQRRDLAGGVPKFEHETAETHAPLAAATPFFTH
jgi:hypothetical protein